MKSSTLRIFVETWSESLTPEQQVELLPSLEGTGPLSEEQEHVLGLEVLDWGLRTYVPTWLDLLPATTPYAAQLRAQPKITDENAASFAPIAHAARDAAGHAAWDAAGHAAGHAARHADWDAVGDAAWDAAGGAIGRAAWGAARGAARGVSWSAARDAVQGAEDPRAAAEDWLAPTVQKLQVSASEMLHRLAEQARWWVDPDAELDRQLAEATSDAERDYAVGRYEQEVRGRGMNPRKLKNRLLR